MVEPGARIADYVVQREIARGGQGVVLAARPVAGGGAPVAIKLLLDATPVSRRRFLREARILARLDHPHLLRVPATGELADGTPYLVLELVDGEDLRSWVRQRGAPPPAEAARILAAVAETLAYCHAQGVVHRDVKPENVLLERGSGRPLLVDFGLVKRDRDQQGTLHDGLPSLTQTGEVLGTPAFMAPEQADPSFGPVGPHSDVYGLGATLYFLLTGEPPFRGTTKLNTLVAVMERPAPDPRQVNPGAPGALAELCLACLSKEAAARPADAAALAQALRGANAPAGTSRPPWLRPAGLLLGLAAAVAVAVALLLLDPPSPATPVESPPMVEPAPTEPEPEEPVREEPVPEEPAAPAWPTKVRKVGKLGDYLLDGAGAVIATGNVGAPDPWKVGGEYILARHAIGNVDADPEPEVVLVGRHGSLFPATVLVLDAQGNPQWRYWHPGYLTGLVLHDADGDGVEEIYLAGVNNDRSRRRGEKVFMRVALCLDALSPGGEDVIHHRDGEGGPERWYRDLGERPRAHCGLRLEDDLLVARLQKGDEQRLDPASGDRR